MVLAVQDDAFAAEHVQRRQSGPGDVAAAGRVVRLANGSMVNAACGSRAGQPAGLSKYLTAHIGVDT